MEINKNLGTRIASKFDLFAKKLEALIEIQFDKLDKLFQFFYSKNAEEITNEYFQK